MKKTMITLAAMFAATVTMAAVTSQIVGYQTFTAGAGYTALTPTFLAVGGTDITFGSIKGDFVDADNLQFFDADGNVVSSATWMTEDFWGCTTGWYLDGDTEAPLADTVIAAGTGFFVSMADGGNILISGSVADTDVELTLSSGYNMVGNCFPAGVNYGALVCTGLTDADNLQFFDTDGNVVSSATWMTEDFWGCTTGWYLDGDTESPLADVAIPAGAAFFFSCAENNVTVQIPTPVL